MKEILHYSTDWLLGFADGGWAIIILAAISFFESIIFPIPPDPFLLAIALIQRPLSIWLAILVTISSVLGALVGYWIGSKLGRPLLSRLFSAQNIAYAEKLLTRYGVWATILAGLTPIPYKVFAIAAGVLGLNLRIFVFASIVGRGIRFLSIGLLVAIYGERIKSFIENNFNIITICIGLVMIIILVGFKMAGKLGLARK